MKVKAVDIARKLNISKASVSLALNGRPGVSDQTRDAVLRCLEDLKSGREIPAVRREGMMIKIIMVSRKLKIIRESELDLWTDVLEVFDREAKKDGYTLGITYVDIPEDDIGEIVMECNGPLIAGVILYATEMDPVDFGEFLTIQKPMIVYDNDLGERFHCVAIDNAAASLMAVDYLAENGCREIRYLSQSTDIYNFRQRRAGFRAGLRKNNIDMDQESMIRIGTTIDTVEAGMREYLEYHELPDAFVMENYQISIGVFHALRAMGMDVPDAVSLIGIDELPNYVTGGFRLTTVRVSHTERAAAVMMLLRREMEAAFPVKFKIFSRCELLAGDSVKEKGLKKLIAPREENG